MNELCYMLQSGDLVTFTRAREKERKKKVKEKDCCDICLILPVGLILPVF